MQRTGVRRMRRPGMRSRMFGRVRVLFCRCGRGLGTRPFRRRHQTQNQGAENKQPSGNHLSHTRNRHHKPQKSSLSPYLNCKRKRGRRILFPSIDLAGEPIPIRRRTVGRRSSGSESSGKLEKQAEEPLFKPFLSRRLELVSYMNPRPREKHEPRFAGWSQTRPD